MENESKVKKILFNEITFGLAIASAVFWLMNYVNNPVATMQLDIALIQASIANIEEDHATYGKDANERDKAITQMQQDIAVIRNILQR